MVHLNGAHVVIYSQKPEADRQFLRDILGLPHVDVGDGWVDDLDSFRGAMAERGVACAPARSLGWGVLTQVPLPGGGRLGVYQPRHRRPVWRPAKQKTRRRGAAASAGPSRRPSVTKAGRRRARRAVR